MRLIPIVRSRALVYAVLAAFAVFMMPGGLAGSGAPVEKGSLTGFIYAKDAKTPVAGAVVKLRNLVDMKELASPPTDANGMYAISGIPEGRYLLGVTSVTDDFNLDYTVYVKGGELGKLSIAMAPGGAGAGQESGATEAKKKGFFATTAGRLVIVAAVGVALYFLIVPQKESSPIR